MSRNDANISLENSCSCSCGRVLNLGSIGWLLLQRRWVKTRESWILTNAHLTDRIDVLIHFPQDGGVMWNLKTPPQFGLSMVDFCAIHHLREGFIMFFICMWVEIGGPNMTQTHKCAIFFFWCQDHPKMW